MDISKVEETMSKAVEKYHDTTILRAAIQAIPYVGGPIDTLLGGQGSKIQEQRLTHFLNEISSKIERLETKRDLVPSEELFDFVVSSFDSVIKARSEDKRKRFAEIFSKQIEKQENWEEAEAASRFLNDLSDLHILVLKEAVTTTPCSTPFTGLRIICFKSTPVGYDSQYPPKILVNELSSYSELALKMACSELMSKGLLYDEGVGRWDTKAMEYLAPTELADWFIDWISD